MPTCPNGHQSAADDWCEVCGHRMAVQGASGGPVPPPPPPPPAAGGTYGYPPQSGQPGQPGAAPELCPQCQTPRDAQAQFCEECRFNFLTGAPAPYPMQGAPQQGYPATGAAPPDYTNAGHAPPHRPAEPIPPAGGETDWNLAPPSSQAPQGAYVPPPAAPQPHQAAPQQHSAPYPPAGQQMPPAPAYPGAPEQSYPPGSPAQTDGYGYPQQAAGPPQVQAQHPGQPPHPGQPQQLGQPPQQFGGPHEGHFPGAPEQSYAQGQHPPGPYASQQAGPPQQAQYGHQPQYAQGGGYSAGWRVTVTQDPEYFSAMMERSGPEGAGLQIPGYGPEQQLPLSGQQVTIGRRRQSTGEAPDIDLSRTPEDPGVSHQHAMLVQQPDGSWAVVDQDSTNGTTLNGAEDPIQPFVPVPLQEGDRVHVGAWTTITLHRV